MGLAFAAIEEMFCQKSDGPEQRSGPLRLKTGRRVTRTSCLCCSLKRDHERFEDRVGNLHRGVLAGHGIEAEVDATVNAASRLFISALPETRIRASPTLGVHHRVARLEVHVEGDG